MPDSNDYLEEGFPRYNGYLCTKCNEIYLARDVDPGATPMFMTCFVTQWCGGQARSLGYPAGDVPFDKYPLLIEFYKPSRQQIRKTKNPALKEHFQRGGLARRVLPGAPDWVKKIA